LVFEGFEEANGGSKLYLRVGVEGMDVGVLVDLVGRDGEIVPRAAAIYSIARLSKSCCEISKNCNVTALERQDATQSP